MIAGEIEDDVVLMGAGEIVRPQMDVRRRSGESRLTRAFA